jgi:hypothetical protein
MVFIGSFSRKEFDAGNPTRFVLEKMDFSRCTVLDDFLPFAFQ